MSDNSLSLLREAVSPDSFEKLHCLNGLATYDELRSLNSKLLVALREERARSAALKIELDDRIREEGTRVARPPRRRALGLLSSASSNLLKSKSLSKLHRARSNKRSRSRVMKGLRVARGW